MYKDVISMVKMILFSPEKQLVQVRRIVNGFLVSKETVVLRRWERSRPKFGFVKRVDKG